ncbi:autotransporter outer membrane beta-barrel domain-containing protein [Phenylobacterium koreense]|uniref:Outer membrane autotransporter protein n=1 Tax=Phenylobacterium koreense TaxID=266125 RepID=A0ABV2EMP1_9CAUL
MRLRHVLLAAASPICLIASAAQAETVISTETTAPVATATAANGGPDNVRISSAGSIKVTGGAAVTLNSDNSITNEGAINIQDANDATGLLAIGGVTGQVKNAGSITINDSAELKDADGDGDLDGAFATGARRFGIRVTGPDAFHGGVEQSAGTISVQGNDSAGISVETAIDGSLRTAGAIGVSGDRTYGVHTASTVGGDVSLLSTITAQGQGAVAVATDGNIGGKLVLGNAITATGFRYTTRPADAAIAKLDADDLLVGGPAVRVSGDVFGGIIVDAPPADLNPANTDEDDDGIADASETTGVINAYGSAPAMLVGSDSRAVRIGVDGRPAGSYGLDIRGVVQSSGVYDGFSTTGVQLGGLGGAVSVEGGVRVLGTVSTASVKAGSTGVLLGAGVTTPKFLVEGGSIKAAATATDAVDVRAIQINSGASVDYLGNSGTIGATITGSKGSATAILDSAGTLRTIENTNTIAAVIANSDGTAVTGSAVALDLRANTQGVTVRQGPNSISTITPSIVGDVLFGSGPAQLELLAGALAGNVAFGSGADTLVIDGGASMAGGLSDAGGGLAVRIGKGRLTTTNVAAINLSSLDVGASGELVLTADPASGQSTLLNVAGAANLASGSKVGLRFASKLDEATTFTLIKAGALNAGSVDQSLLESTPWLYRTELRVDAANNSLLADVRRRTATEAGLNAGEAGAYDAFFANFDREAAVRDAVLSKTDAGSFAALYDQFLPDFSGSLFHTLAAASDATSRAIDEADGVQTGAGLRVWTQEIAFLVKRDVDRTTNYDADGFGLAAGVEAPYAGIGTLGVMTSFVNVDVDDDGAAIAESLGGQVFSAGVYWRDQAGGLVANFGLNGGYAKLKSTRVVNDLAAGLNREAKSDWNGFTASAHAGLAYQVDMGRFYVKPNLTADYFLLKEDGRTESGGGEAIDLSIDKRSSDQLSGFAGVTFGARFGEESAFAWVPELTAGWRQATGDGVDVTTARFVAGGPSFSLEAPNLSGGGPVVRAALRGQGEYFDFALEGGGEYRDDYEAYDARVVVRFLF